MAQYTIEVPEVLDKLLKEFSALNNLAPDVYAGNIVKSWLESQYRGRFLDEMKKKKVADLEGMKDVVFPKKVKE